MDEGRGGRTTAKVRFYENDWLTVFATVAVFLFHCSRYFNYEDWHVKNPVHSDALSAAVVLLSQWIMPLFFLLSGMSSGYSLKRRSATVFVLDRFKRLMIPFLFSVFVVSMPLQVWIERVSHGQFGGSFIEFYPKYFEGFYAFGGNFAWMGLHLWYLLLLFLFSVLALPVLLMLRRWREGRTVTLLARFCGVPGGVFVFALPVFLVELWVNTDPNGLGMRAMGGWSPLTYLLVFSTGAVLSCSGLFRSAFSRNAFPALLLAMVTAALVLAQWKYHMLSGDGAGYVGEVALRACNSWFWLSAIYGLGCRFLSFDGRALPWLRETALPFYIVHQTVIVGLGYVLLNVRVPVWAKYPLLTVASFVVIVCIVEAVRRVSVLRPLFGLPTMR